MFTAPNEPPVSGALCMNCRSDLRSLIVDAEIAGGKTSESIQLFACANENCTKAGLVTNRYFPGAIGSNPDPA